MRFSSRIPHDLAPSSLQKALARATTPYDLTHSNPTRVGLTPCHEAVALALQKAGATSLPYDPHPLGMFSAREAVCHYLQPLGIAAHPDTTFLTASTSEAYAHLLKLCCNPGDVIAVPTPSYPLVPHLAELEGVQTLSYRLDPERSYAPNLGDIREALLRGAAILVVISLNNPTGTEVDPDTLARIAALCAEYNCVLVVDRVFGPYGSALGSSAWHMPESDGIVCILDGLSKAALLPQHKLGWTTVHGPAQKVAAFMERVTWILDAYLSVNAMTQVALPALLALAPRIQAAVNERLAQNRQTLSTSLKELAPRYPFGGWSALIPLGATDEESWVVALAQAHGVKVQPGYFYDAPEASMVVSLITSPDIFTQGLLRVKAALPMRR